MILYKSDFFFVFYWIRISCTTAVMTSDKNVLLEEMSFLKYVLLEIIYFCLDYTRNELVLCNSFGFCYNRACMGSR